MDVDRVSKIVRMLASDNDAEVVSAARALQSVLKASGHDINDLAAVIVKGFLPGAVTAKLEAFLADKIRVTKEEVHRSLGLEFEQMTGEQLREMLQCQRRLGFRRGTWQGREVLKRTLGDKARADAFRAGARAEGG